MCAFGSTRELNVTELSTGWKIIRACGRVGLWGAKGIVGKSGRAVNRSEMSANLKRYESMRLNNLFPLALVGSRWDKVVWA